MIILTTEAEQTFTIIPTRESNEVESVINLLFIEDGTNQEIEIEVSSTYSISDIFYIFSNNLSFLKENSFYFLKVYFQGTDEIIYRDRVFCTNQPKDAYSINDGVYTLPNIDNNNYITI